MIDFLANEWITPHFFSISFGSVFFYSTSSVSFGFLFPIHALFHGSLLVFSQFLVFFHMFFTDGDLWGFLPSSLSWRKLFVTLETFCW